MAGPPLASERVFRTVPLTVNMLTERVSEMAEYMAKRNPDRCPTHPGAILREDVLPALGMSKTAIADGLGISRQHLYDILNEKKPVSPKSR
jgi:hypothetical protein